jgi:hypothetical protein
MKRLPRFAIWCARILLPILIEPIAAPYPQLRLRHQPTFHRILVHITQILDPLLPTPHVEIIKPPLPEAPRRVRWCPRPQSHLVLLRPLSRLPPQSTRYALLQDLHHRRRRAHLRLPDQQVNVFRHHHVPSQPELISLPDLNQDPQERIALPPRSQQGPPPVTTARDKVQLPLPIPPL